MGVPLAAEIAAARVVAGLSRLVGAGGGTTVPGKLLSKLDPGAVDRLAGRLPAGTATISATNGKTTTAAMAAEILRPRLRLAHNRSGANLLSGVASTLLAAGGAELGLLEVDEAALPEVIQRVSPRAVCLGNLFRDQLDRACDDVEMRARMSAVRTPVLPEVTDVRRAVDIRCAAANTVLRVGRVLERRPGNARVVESEDE